MSWWQIKCWLKYPQENSALIRELRKRAAEEEAEKAAEDAPVDQRSYGKDPLPADEMISWLGQDWEDWARCQKW